MVGDMFVGQFRYLVNNYSFLLLLYSGVMRAFYYSVRRQGSAGEEGEVFSLRIFLSVLVRRIFLF